MKLQRTKLGFTLIELLVVITIIGILATGAVGVYTSQIQKARDTTRISDMSVFKGALEQAFQDMGMYPGNAKTKAATVNCDTSGVETDTGVHCVVKLGFMNSLPKDPKNGQQGNGSILTYTYKYGNVNGVVNQAFEVSTGVESDGIKSGKAKGDNDGGNDDARIEFGTLVDGTTTTPTAITTETDATGTYTGDSCDTNTVSSSVWVGGNCPD